MKVFVAGGTGAIGQPLVRQLVAAGHQVTATTRRPARLDVVRALGAEAVVMDALDGGQVGEVVARAAPDAVIHQLTALTGDPDLRRFDRTFATTNALRTDGTDHLLAAAQAAGASRFIAQSYTGWNNSRTGGPVKTEADPLDPDPAPAQRESMRAIQHLERAVLAAPLSGTVLRYGSFYGPGTSDSMLGLIRERKFPLVGGGTAVWSFIHLEDAAAATVAALGHDGSDVFHVVEDEPAPVAEWLPYIAEERPPAGQYTYLAMPGGVAVKWTPRTTPRRETL